MAEKPEGGGKEFLTFLRSVPTLEEATSGATTQLTGMVFRGEEGRFAITTGEGQTYELDASAVQRFKVIDAQSLSPVVTLQVASEVLSKASIRAVKPIVKDVVKDVIKDLVADPKRLPKDLLKDPIKELPWDPKVPWKDPPKDLPKDVPTKELPKDPPKEFLKDPPKDLPKDVFETGVRDPGGTGIADTLVETFDPGQGGVINPQQGFGGVFAGGDLTPFVMATPHHAPAHMIQAQMGAQPGLTAAAAGGAGLKPLATDTAKELAYETVFQLDRPKQLVFDTRKELIFDTRKELVYETWVETGPNTIQETTFDPGGLVTQPPIWGLPGVMF